MKLGSMLVCAAVLVWSLPARADVVNPPPADCPPGTEGNTCHGGPHCRPLSCTTDAECTGGAVCRDRMLCVFGIDCSGGWSDPDAKPPLSPAAEKACTSGSDCSGAATCDPVKVCVVESAAASSGSSSSTASTGPSSGGDDGGCSCRAAGAGGDHGAAWCAAIALAIGARMRRRRA